MVQSLLRKLIDQFLLVTTRRRWTALNWCAYASLVLVLIGFSRPMPCQDVEIIGREVAKVQDEKTEILTLIGKYVMMKSVEDKKIMLQGGKYSVRLINESDLGKLKDRLEIGGKETAEIMLDEMGETEVFNACLPIVLNIIAETHLKKFKKEDEKYELKYKDFELLSISGDKIWKNSVRNPSSEDLANIIRLLRENL